MPTVYRWVQRVAQVAEPTVADCAPGRAPGRAPQVPRLDEAEERAVRGLYLLTNRTLREGSVPEALRLAMARGLLRPAIAELIRGRLDVGLPALPAGQMRRLRVSGPVVRALRGPRGAWLEHVQSPGSLMYKVDEVTREQRLVQPGERWTLDDASINFVCCVPGLERPGDRCWERWGVCVGRFQWLVAADHRTRFITGWSYTARPRDSYRAEDLTATLHVAMSQHGAPREIVLEKGVSAAGLVSETLGALGVKILRASSPHEKVIEGMFNSLWTMLSTVPGQIGRRAGDEEAANRLLQRCRDGAVDPRNHFPMLADTLQALREAVSAYTHKWIESERYGRWVPAEFWGRESGKWLRRLTEEEMWAFSPHVTGPLKVHGMRVETSVPLLPGQSLKFHYAADWLAEWDGCLVKLFFNPIGVDEASAVAVLAEGARGSRAGTVLGRLDQIDCHTRYTRRALGYGLDPDIGQGAAAAMSRGLRQHVESVLPDGRPGVVRSEVRGADGLVAKVEMDAPGGREGVDGAPAGAAAVLPGRARSLGRAAAVPGPERRWVDPRLSEISEEESECTN